MDKLPTSDQGMIFRPEEVDAGDRATKKSKRKRPVQSKAVLGQFHPCIEGRHKDCPYHVYVQCETPPRWETCECPCGHEGRTTSHAWLL